MPKNFPWRLNPKSWSPNDHWTKILTLRVAYVYIKWYKIKRCDISRENTHCGLFQACWLFLTIKKIKKTVSFHFLEGQRNKIFPVAYLSLCKGHRGTNCLPRQSSWLKPWDTGAALEMILTRIRLHLQSLQSRLCSVLWP